MHELSIACNLVETAETAARDAGVEQVSAVHVRVGALSGVVKESLLFAYDLVVKDTLLEGSQLVVEEVPVIVYCPSCDANVALTSLHKFACPHCKTPTPRIVSGRELQLVALEIEDAETFPDLQ
ncbi:MAG: hydrogenase maturation nickel metallochaperone HypA [Chloroflexota bacterium]|nr:hydrogenase maturation nickel metallochaperone HypA [Chloroflexota bacterium]